MSMTLKQIGDDVRKRLAAAQANGTLPRTPRYDVRVTSKTGAVNVTINGYEDLIPGVENREPGDLKRWATEGYGAQLLAGTDGIVGRQRFTPALGGETKFGPCIVVTGTTVRHETNA